LALANLRVFRPRRISIFPEGTLTRLAFLTDCIPYLFDR
jgi:hypothetical protein